MLVELPVSQGGGLNGVLRRMRAHNFSRSTSRRSPVVRCSRPTSGTRRRTRRSCGGRLTRERGPSVSTSPETSSTPPPGARRATGRASRWPTFARCHSRTLVRPDLLDGHDRALPGLSDRRRRDYRVPAGRHRHHRRSEQGRSIPAPLMVHLMNLWPVRLRNGEVVHPWPASLAAGVERFSSPGQHRIIFISGLAADGGSPLPHAVQAARADLPVLLVEPFARLYRSKPGVRRHGYMIACVCTRPG